MTPARARARRFYLAGFALAVTVLGLVGVLAITAIDDQARAVEWVEHTLDVIAELRRSASELAQAESDLRGAALVRDPGLLAAFDAELGAAEDSLAHVRQLTADNAVQQDRLDDLEPRFRRRLSLLRDGRTHVASGLELADVRGAAELSSMIRADTAAMIHEEERLLTSRSETARHGAAQTRRIALGGLVLGGLFAVGAVLLLGRSLRARREAERSLGAERQLLQSVIEGTTDPVFVKDVGGRYLLANPAAARTLGRPLVEIVGRTDLELFDPETAAATRARDLEVIREGASRTFEQETPVAGGVRRFAITKSPLRDADQRICGVVAIARDVTGERQAHELRLRQLTGLLRLADTLHACRTSAEAYEAIGNIAPGLVASPGAVFVFAASRNVLEPRCAWGGLAMDGEDALFAPDDCWALRRGQRYLLGDGAGLACKHVTAPREVVTLCVPMQANGETVGLLHLRSSVPLTEEQQEQAAVLGEEVGMTLANLALRETLRNQSIRDPLTGLFNRRYTEETLLRELSRAAREKIPVAVLAVDVDHFKRFNDTFGHAAGDHVLRELATLLGRRTRGGDVASRMGGEELLIVLPGADPVHAVQKAEALRAEIARLAVVHLGKPLGPITVSIGVAVYPAHGSNSDELLQAADAALYRAKSGGRDRVEVAE